MGCDIHVKTYLWSKVENRYIDAFEFMEAYSIKTESIVPSIVEDRFYDLFGAFGNTVRSYYPAMKCLRYGIPPFLKGSTLVKYLDLQGGNFGYVWTLLPELKKETLRYMRMLKDPEIYYENDEDSDPYLDYKKGLFSKKDFEKENCNVISGIREIRKKVRIIEKNLSTDWAFDKKTITSLFDAKKTVFFIWFDN